MCLLLMHLVISWEILLMWVGSLTYLKIMVVRMSRVVLAGQLGQLCFVVLRPILQQAVLHGNGIGARVQAETPSTCPRASTDIMSAQILFVIEGVVQPKSE